MFACVLNNITWCQTCVAVGCGVHMYVFIVRGSGWRWVRILKAQSSDSKTQDIVASGWGWVTHCLTVTWLLKTQRLLNLRGVEAWTPAQPPSQKTPGYLSPGLTLRHSTRGREERRSAAEKGEYSRDVSRVVSPGSGVKGRHGGGMSGVKWSRQASVGLVKCLPGDLRPGGNTKQL